MQERKIDTLYDFIDRLTVIKQVMNKAKAANDALYDSYFGEYGGNNPCIMTEYGKAYSLHTIVTDYIEQSCEEIKKMLNS